MTITNPNDTIRNKIQRNPFVALCEYASTNNWCWKLFCTTCGHGAFGISISKLVHGKHPDDDSFWPYGKKNHSPLKEDLKAGKRPELKTVFLDNGTPFLNDFRDWMDHYYSANFKNRLYCPYFIIGVHHAYQNRVIFQRVFNVFRIDKSVFGNGQIRNFRRADFF